MAATVTRYPITLRIESLKSAIMEMVFVHQRFLGEDLSRKGQVLSEIATR
jgi:hypothetical protein